MRFSEAKLNWMKQVLQERFGILFILEFVENTLVLGIDGNKKKINFPFIEEAFYIFGETELNCYDWNAEEVGLHGVIEPILKAPSLNLLKQPLIQYSHNGALINYDILGLTYWMLNRLEEIGRSELDIHGRFSSKSSHAMKYGYLDRPIVDEWLDILKQVIQKVWPKLNLKNNQFRMYISHDVDIPSKYGFLSFFKILKTIAKDVIKENNLRSLFLAPYIRLNTKENLNKRDPFNTFDWIMTESEKNNIKSSFYFICGQTDRLRDADYRLNDPSIKKLLLEIYNRGHEIGLHPSYNSFQNQKAIINEFNTLKNTCENLGIKQNHWGGRMHFLRWRHPETLGYLNDCGLSYDTTLGYADHAGFRAGTCHEFVAFDHLSDTILNIKIRPLIVMEATVLSPAYMNVGERSLDVFLDLKMKCRKVNGQFTLLWHNSQFDNEVKRELYRNVLTK